MKMAQPIELTAEERRAETGRKLAEARAAAKVRRAAEKVEAPAAEAAGLLSAAEEAEARAQARADAQKKLQADSRKKRLKEIAAEEEARVLAEDRAASGRADLNEIVSFTVSLPEFADRMMIDGVIYMNGQTYQVTRARFNSMAETMHKMREHEHNLSGKKRSEHYRQINPLLAQELGHSLNGQLPTETVQVH